MLFTPSIRTFKLCRPPQVITVDNRLPVIPHGTRRLLGPELEIDQACLTHPLFVHGAALHTLIRPIFPRPSRCRSTAPCWKMEPWPLAFFADLRLRVKTSVQCSQFRPRNSSESYSLRRSLSVPNEICNFVVTAAESWEAICWKFIHETALSFQGKNLPRGSWYGEQIFHSRFALFFFSRLLLWQPN